MDIKLFKFILCDDIRIEKNDKLVIIGMYPNDKIVVRSAMPYIHPSLSFFINIKGDFKSGDLYFSILSENGDTIVSLPPIEMKGDGNSLEMNLGITNFKIDSAGIFKLVLTFPNNKPFEIPFEIIHKPVPKKD